jgi:uncharacterized protein (TIRG00374 family)
LLVWSFRRVPFADVWVTLGHLSTAQIALWLLLNLGLVILMSGRWWLILRSLGARLPYLALVRYRLGAFAVSYFTPGPQFGGEPLQVLALRQHYAIPGTTGTASVGLDKLLDLIANFSFLVFGVAVVLVRAWLPDAWRSASLGAAFGLLTLPLAYLILMLAGRQPFNKLLARFAHFRWVAALCQVEGEMSAFCVAHPRTVLRATLLSLAIWVGMVLEYWLLTTFFGLRLSLSQTVSALTAARLAFLTPLPAGLGALEASQVLALQALGIEASFGVSISLLIRFRDLLFGVAGLLGLASLLRRRFPAKTRNPEVA